VLPRTPQGKVDYPAVNALALAGKEKLVELRN
jgi:hypothetical protein